MSGFCSSIPESVGQEDDMQLHRDWGSLLPPLEAPRFLSRKSKTNGTSNDSLGICESILFFIDWE